MGQHVHEKYFITVKLHFWPFRLCVGACAGAGAFAGAWRSLSSTCTPTVTVFGLPETVCSIAGSGV